MTETPRATLSRLMPTILAVAALAAGAVLVWQLSQMLLLVFAAALVAVLLRAGADLVCAWTPLGPRAAAIVTLLVAAALLLGFFALLGRRIYAEVSDLVSRAPELISAAEERLGAGGLEDWLSERIASAGQGAAVVDEVASYVTLALGGVANLVLVLIAGAFMAYAPGLYRDGLVSLFPPRRHSQVLETLDAAGDGLRLWLVGQLVAMALVGVLSTVGLMLLGVPSAFGLGFIAALTNFVPYVGPFLGAAPAVAVALGEQPSLALWVAGLFLGIQQIEGNIITPLIQQRTVELPPALTIFAILGFGMLFGFLGVVLGAPLAALAFVLVKKLWVRDALHEETTLPGEGS